MKRVKVNPYSAPRRSSSARQAQPKPPTTPTGADHAHGKPVVADQRPLEEIAEVSVDERIDIGIAPVLQDKGRQAAQVAGRSGTPVDVPDDGRIVRLVEGGELRRQSFRNEVLDQIGQEHLSQHGGAAFIADDETASVDVPDHFFAVILTGVGAGAQDDRDAGLVAAGRAGGRHQVGRILAPGLREAFLEHAVQFRGKLQQAGRIEIHLVYAGEMVHRIGKHDAVFERKVQAG